METSRWTTKNSAYNPVSRDIFHTILREWLQRAERDTTIGDVGNYGGRGWLYVRHDGHVFRLHADANESGVAEYLSRLDDDPNLQWTVVENRRGRRNKVVFGIGNVPIPGFYLYLDD